MNLTTDVINLGVQKERDEYLVKCQRGEVNCLVGDRERIRGTFREFVIFDEEQVYPNYIIWHIRLDFLT